MLFHQPSTHRSIKPPKIVQQNFPVLGLIGLLVIKTNLDEKDESTFMNIGFGTKKSFDRSLLHNQLDVMKLKRESYLGPVSRKYELGRFQSNRGNSTTFNSNINHLTEKTNRSRSKDSSKKQSSIHQINPFGTGLYSSRQEKGYNLPNKSRSDQISKLLKLEGESLRRSIHGRRKSRSNDKDRLDSNRSKHSNPRNSILRSAHSKEGSDRSHYMKQEEYGLNRQRESLRFQSSTGSSFKFLEKQFSRPIPSFYKKYQNSLFPRQGTTMRNHPTIQSFSITQNEWSNKIGRNASNNLISKEKSLASKIKDQIVKKTFKPFKKAEKQDLERYRKNVIESKPRTRSFEQTKNGNKVFIASKTDKNERLTSIFNLDIGKISSQISLGNKQKFAVLKNNRLAGSRSLDQHYNKNIRREKVQNLVENNKSKSRKSIAGNNEVKSLNPIVSIQNNKESYRINSSQAAAIQQAVTYYLKSNEKEEIIKRKKNSEQTEMNNYIQSIHAEVQQIGHKTENDLMENQEIESSLRLRHSSDYVSTLKESFDEGSSSIEDKLLGSPNSEDDRSKRIHEYTNVKGEVVGVPPLKLNAADPIRKVLLDTKSKQSECKSERTKPMPRSKEVIMTPFSSSNHLNSNDVRQIKDTEVDSERIDLLGANIHDCGDDLYNVQGGLEEEILIRDISFWKKNVSGFTSGVVEGERDFTERLGGVNSSVGRNSIGFMFRTFGMGGQADLGLKSTQNHDSIIKQVNSMSFGDKVEEASILEESKPKALNHDQSNNKNISHKTYQCIEPGKTAIPKQNHGIQYFGGKRDRDTRISKDPKQSFTKNQRQLIMKPGPSMALFEFQKYK